MFKFITGMLIGVILTFTLSAITDESIDDLEYDPDFDEDIYEEGDEWEDEIVD